MRNMLVTTAQHLVNKINAKVDFTYPKVTKRYIVGVRSLHTSKNPSIFYDGIYKDTKIAIDFIEERGGTIGGWLDTDTGLYHVDKGLDFDDLDIALDWGRAYHQKAIYDTEDDKVIVIESLTDEA